MHPGDKLHEGLEAPGAAGEVLQMMMGQLELESTGKSPSRMRITSAASNVIPDNKVSSSDGRQIFILSYIQASPQVAGEQTQRQRHEKERE